MEYPFRWRLNRLIAASGAVAALRFLPEPTFTRRFSQVPQRGLENSG